MRISGIVKSSLVDFPDLLSCVFFVPGCNYNCFYCHNRSLLDGSGEEISREAAEDFLDKRAGFLDGAVISGGEPTLQPDLASFIKSVRERGYKIKLDTNGSRPQVVRQLLGSNLCDYVAVDYKAPADRYKEICGPEADAGRVQETIKLLLDHKIPFEVRTTVIPQLDTGDLLRMSEEFPPVPKYVLNRYRKPEKYLSADRLKVEQPPYTQAQIDSFAHLIRTRQPHVMT